MTEFLLACKYFAMLGTFCSVDGKFEKLFGWQSCGSCLQYLYTVFYIVLFWQSFCKLAIFMYILLCILLRENLQTCNIVFYYRCNYLQRFCKPSILYSITGVTIYRDFANLQYCILLQGKIPLSPSSPAIYLSLFLVWGEKRLPPSPVTSTRLYNPSAGRPVGHMID